MSYVNAGPIVLTDAGYEDSPTGAVTAADLDNLVVEFDVEFDTAYDSGYVYLGDITALTPGSDVMIIRMQPDGTNLNFFFTEQNDYATTVVFEPPNTSAQPLALNTVGSVRITHDETRLLSVYLNDVLVDSGIHANVLDMGVERFHLGYGGAGNATFTNINVSAPVPAPLPVVTDLDTDEITYKGQSTFTVTVTDVPETVHSWGFRFDVSTEEATAISRSGDVFTLGITAEIQALPDDEELDGTFWFRPHDYVAP